MQLIRPFILMGLESQLPAREITLGSSLALQQPAQNQD